MSGRRRQAAGADGSCRSPAIKLANAELAKTDQEPIPEGLTPHGLRRTFASLLIEKGENPSHVMFQMGHTDPALTTLSLYAHAMRRRDGEKERLQALIEGEDWAPIGHQDPFPAKHAPSPISS